MDSHMSGEMTGLSDEPCYMCTPFLRNLSLWFKKYGVLGLLLPTCANVLCFFAVIDYLAVHTNVLEANCFPMFYIMDTCLGLVLWGAVCFQLAIKTMLMGGTLRFQMCRACPLVQTVEILSKCGTNTSDSLDALPQIVRAPRRSNSFCQEPQWKGIYLFIWQCTAYFPSLRNKI